MLYRQQIQIVSGARFGSRPTPFEYVTKQSLWSRIWSWLMEDL